MALLIVSFLAGILTVLAPCVLPLLPVVIGSSASGRSRWTPYIVVASLSGSIILFTFILKASTAFIMVPPAFWQGLSGGILALFGLTLLFPGLWERVPGLAQFSAGSNKLVGKGYQAQSAWGDVLVGAALGPVFSTCSPTYFVILASVLPVSFLLGTTYLLAYVFGLAIVLLGIARVGQRLADRLTGVADSRSYLKRGAGVLFLVLGVLIATGYEKKIETAILDGGYFDITKLETRLLERTQGMEGGMPEASGPRYAEIAQPAGFVNTDSITIGELVGKKIVLVDFLTYSCINCQRTFPYLNAWYEKYRDQGLEIVGIHTPEFAFEKDINNVREAMQRFGIQYPIVLDNDYGTWRAWGNQYWPRKYLIDIHGVVVYDHIGEGGYEETETKIRELLAERAQLLGTDMPTGDSAAAAMPPAPNAARSPETYFGSLRNEYMGNVERYRDGRVWPVLPPNPLRNTLYLGGAWAIQPEYAISQGTDAVIIYAYDASEVFVVADADAPVVVEVWQDGKPIDAAAAGDDVAADGTVTVRESRLYKLVRNQTPGAYVLELRVKGEGARFYAFTFG
ncbi:redoxin domain-containing protein [Candidatus Kaiserbacteria bacterium]|nr:redoxin domain-containing protein [Candidatus Kaiserbacteria bacterium]